MKQKFNVITSSCIPLPLENVDTDQIIPARFLKAIDKEGMGDNLFRDWRYNADGTPKPDFVMNDPSYSGVILVAGKNFGSGSSREHAAWAIAGAGFRVVISSFFADIHKNNELNNLVLPVVVSEEFLKELFESIDKEGMGDNLFRDWRYNADGTPKPDFVMNDPSYSGVILVAGKNFGSGSSREHAAWAIAGAGFRVVISSFFADIHKNNELNNLVLPVVVSEEFLKELFESIDKDHKTEVKVDLPNQTVTNLATGKSEHFEINGYKKHCLENGLDDVDFLVQNRDKVEAWEAKNK